MTELILKAPPALNVKEGDYLEAQIVKDGVLLKPVEMVERERAWKGIVHATSRVKDLKPNPKESATAKEEAIARWSRNTAEKRESMPKVVLDTTVLVSSFLNPNLGGGFSHSSAAPPRI